MFNLFKKKESQPTSPIPPSIPVATNPNAPLPFGTPENELERALLAKHKREIDVIQLINTVFNSQISILVPEDQFTTVEGKRQLVSNPRIFTLTQQSGPFLVMFSSPKRTKPAIDRYSQFRYAAEVHAGNFLMSMPQSLSFGLIINPYWEAYIQWMPDQLQQIRARVRQ